MISSCVDIAFFLCIWFWLVMENLYTGDQPQEEWSGAFKKIEYHLRWVGLSYYWVVFWIK